MLKKIRMKNKIEWIGFLVCIIIILEIKVMFEKIEKSIMVILLSFFYYLF